MIMGRHGGLPHHRRNGPLSVGQASLPARKKGGFETRPFYRNVGLGWWGGSLTGRSEKKFIIILFLAAFAARMLWIFLVAGIHSTPVADQAVYDRIALNVAEARGFSINAPAPTAERAPLFPLVLAAVYRVAGHEPSAGLVLQALLGAAIVVLIFRLGREMFPDLPVGPIASLLAVPYPVFLYFSGILSTENLTVVCLLAFLCSALSLRRNPGIAARILCGLMLGAALLTRPVTILLLMLLPLWVWIDRSRPARDRCRDLACIVVTALLCCVPWTLRNAVVLDAFVPMTTGGGAVFWGGNNRLVLEDPKGRSRGGWVPITSVPEWEEVLRSTDGTMRETLTEVEGNRRSYRMGLRFLNDNRGDIPALVGRKLARLWAVRTRFADRNREITLANLFSYGILLPFFLFGLFRVLVKRGWREDLAPAWIMILWVNCYGALFYGSLRFRFPVEPLILLFAALGICELKRLLPRRSPSDVPSPDSIEEC